MMAGKTAAGIIRLFGVIMAFTLRGSRSCLTGRLIDHCDTNLYHDHGGITFIAIVNNKSRAAAFLLIYISLDISAYRAARA